MRRTPLRVLPALLLVLPLTACGDDDPAAAQGEPLGDGVVWYDGAEIHFPGGELVDAGEDLLEVGRTSHGVVTTSLEDGSVAYVTPDGRITDLDIPQQAKVATDARQALVAWTEAQPVDGVVHVLDLATGKERAAVETGYDDTIPLEISLEGNKVWLYDNELATTLEVDWPSGKVTPLPVNYVRTINSRYATVEGGNENFVEAGAAKPGIVDLETHKLVRRGWDWEFSPRATYAVTIIDDGDRSTPDTRVGVLDLATGKLARLPATLDESGWLTWAWTPDERTIYWFEGRELVTCTVAASTCTRDEVDAEIPQVV